MTIVQPSFKYGYGAEVLTPDFFGDGTGTLTGTVIGVSGQVAPDHPGVAENRYLVLFPGDARRQHWFDEGEVEAAS